MAPDSVTHVENTVCPHCKYETGDAWELFLSNDEEERILDCEQCGEKFAVSRNTTVDYTCRPLELSDMVTR